MSGVASLSETAGAGAVAAEARAGEAGDADLRAIPADDVHASVHSGGDVMVRAEKTLEASAHSGGSIEYWGHPAVISQVHSGGSVESGE